MIARESTPLGLAIDAHGPPLSRAWVLVHHDEGKK